MNLFADWAAAIATATVLAACVHPGMSSHMDQRAHVTRLTLEYAEAFGRNDVATLERLRLPEFRFITSTGRVVPNEAELSDIRAGIARAEAAALSEVEARTRGDAVVVTARAMLRGTWHGQRYDGNYRLSLTWVRTDDGWRLLNEQSSRIADPEPPRT